MSDIGGDLCDSSIMDEKKKELEEEKKKHEENKARSASLQHMLETMEIALKEKGEYLWI